jgi:hypothetical protein
MTVDQKRRQKKLAKKAAKRKTVLAGKRKRDSFPVTKDQALWAASISPIHECLVPKGIFDLGIGDVIISRKMPDGSIAASVFLVDTFCLGVKDCFFTIVSPNEYKSRIMDLRQKEGLESVEPEYAAKLIENAVSYAEDLGFKHHKDYPRVKKIFGSIDPSVCSSEFECGKDGKPFYVSGPNQTEADSKKIIHTLNERLGPDGFHYLVKMDIEEDLGEE